MQHKPQIPIQFKVFISSKDDLHNERAAVEDAVVDLGLIPVRAETESWLATPMRDEYLRQVRLSQIVVLVVAPVDTLTVGEEYYKHVKAEVDIAFDEGKTVLLFVRSDRRSPAPNQDLFLKSVKHKVFSRTFSDTSELLRLVKISLVNELVRRYSGEAFLSKNRRHFYDFAAKFVREARIRLVVSQLTPTVLLGPRAKLPYETLLYDALLEVATRAKREGEPIVTIVYNESTTAAELKGSASDYDTHRFTEYCQAMRALVCDHVSVVAASDTIPFVVVDHRYAVGQAGGNRVIVIVNEGAQICGELCEMAQVYTSAPPDAGIECFERLISHLKV